MNPGKLNQRIKFIQLSSTQNDYGGSVPTEIPVVCSDIAPTDTTWGDLQPIRQNNQLALEAGASVLNGDKVLKIRYRKTWEPEKDMIFIDGNDRYTVHSILPYDEKNNNGVFQDKKFIYILGIKRA